MISHLLRAMAAVLLLQPIVLPAFAPTIPARIPIVDGTTLTGDHVRLPDALAGPTPRLAVLIVGFSKAARDPARDWGKRLAADYFHSPTILYFEMPVVAGVPRLLRGYVLRSIADEVSDRGKPHFLPITADEPRWRTLAGYSAPDAAYLLVIDSTGSVLWRTSAAPSDSSYRDLQQHLAHPAPAAAPVLP